MSPCQRRIVSGMTSSCSPWRRIFGVTASNAAGGCPVRPVKVRAARQPLLQDDKLVTKRQDLGALPCLLMPRQPQPGDYSRDREEDEPQAHDDDHPGQTARRSTLLVTVADEIFGTHNTLMPTAVAGYACNKLPTLCR